MRKTGMVLVGVLLGLALASSGQAQTLEAGLWTGKVIPPDGGQVDVTYAVAYSGDSLTISISIPIGNIPFQNIELSKGTLSFSWDPGIHLECALRHQEDGRYEGECIDDGGAPGQLTMVPPAEQ